MLFFADGGCGENWSFCGRHKWITPYCMSLICQLHVPECHSLYSCMPFSCHLCVIRTPFVCTPMSFIYHSNVLVCYFYVICISLVCIRMSFVWHQYVLVSHSHVTLMYSHVIRISPVCTRMSFVCHSYVLVCHLFVTRMNLYVIRMSLVCTLCHSYVFLPWTCSKQ